MWSLELSKESFKFAASHFAIFGPHCGERLHGHNYYVSLSFVADQLDENLGLAVEFNELKPIIYNCLQALDEYILFPADSPYLKCEESEKNWKIQFADKTYSLPKEDVKFLPVKNISCEELSRYLSVELRGEFNKFKNIKQFSVTVQETKGQKASFLAALG